MRCFVTNKNYHDFSILKKEKPEEIVYLTEGKPNIFHTDRMKQQMIGLMKVNQITKDDFIVISGAGILNCLAVLAMRELVGQVNVMIFNFSDKTYKKRLKV